MIGFKSIDHGLFGDWMGSAKFLIKKSPGKYRIVFEHMKIVFEENVKGNFVQIDELVFDKYKVKEMEN